MIRKTVILVTLIILASIFSNAVLANTSGSKGIYINQGTLENTKYLKYLIKESKEVGINTFVVDLAKVTRNYEKNVKLIKDAGIRYVARVVIFPDGASKNQLKDRSIWENRLKLMESAIGFGADAIQLDYIRYNTKQTPSPQNAKDVREVIKFFKEKVAAHNIPLQIDIFGEVSFKESPRIGQNIEVFADTVDVACPMVYPSHYAPYDKHSKQPYQTVYNSLVSLKKKFPDNNTPFKLNPFIEATNYHYKMSSAQKTAYVMSQIRAVEDANADGWYMWSAGNYYDHVFNALKNRTSLSAKAKDEHVLTK